MSIDAREIFREVEAPTVASDGTKEVVNAEDSIPRIGKFQSNNWLKTSTNPILNKVFDKGGALWLSRDGDLSYRFSPKEAFVKNTTAKTATVLSNFLNQKVSLFTGDEPHIRPTDLKMVNEDIFNPFISEEFIDKGSYYQRNTFMPTSYMGLSGKPSKEPKAILSLIRNLSNENEEYFKWILNWLALFFQTLKRSQVSLVLRGEQGAGKGILFDDVLKPLFGYDQCINVNDKALEQTFLGGIVEGRLFFNIDEVSHNIASSKKVKNFLKALVTNNGIVTEKKFVTTEKETPLYGQVFISSNEPFVIEVEHNDRRYTVMQTGESIKHTFLGYGSYEKLSHAIKEELEDFARYLLQYQGDKMLFNTALDTPEKRALIIGTQDKFSVFVNAIKNKDGIFFEESLSDFSYRELLEDFSKDRVCKEELQTYFIKSFEEEISSKKLFNRLRVIDPLFFDIKNTKKSNGKNYFLLKSLQYEVI